MKSKKGFTMIELLAVVGILAILVIIVIPAVLDRFKEAKKDTFSTEIKTIYNAANKKKLFDYEDKVYNTGDLDISGGSDLEYSISLNQQGKIKCFEIASRDYMWSYRSVSGYYADADELLSKELDIVERDQNYILDCSTDENFDTTVSGSLAHGNTWWRSEKTDPSSIERIVFTNSYKPSGSEDAFFADEENVGGLTAYVENNIAYVLIRRHKRYKEAFTLSSDASNTFSDFTNLKSITGLKLIDFSNVTNMDNFFGKVEDGKLTGCTKLKSISGSESWNTSNVQSASYAFAGLPLSSINLSSWSMSSLKNASGMFYKTSAKEINLSSWNTSNVNDFSNMFYGNNDLQLLYLNNWSTNGSAKYKNMFSKCGSLVNIIASNNFKVNSTSENMFEDDKSLVGANGTTYQGNSSLYAKVDNDTQKGYFSSKALNGAVSAKLYDTGSVSTSYTELTKSGATPSDWNYYNGARLLEVKIFSMPTDSTKTLDISVPTGMYILDGSWTKKGKGIASVSFETLSNQGTGTYKNTQTGTLKYTINKSTSNITIQCLVMFDETIWDKNAKNEKDYLTTNMTLSPAVVVNYNSGETVKKIGNIASSTGIGKSANGYSLYTYNYNNNVYVGESKRLLADTAFLQTDQSTVSYYYKTAEFESYAYSTDKDGNKIYAKITGITDGSIGSTTKNASNDYGYSYSYSWKDVYLKNKWLSFPKLNYLMEEDKGFVEGKKLSVYVKVTVTTMSGQRRILEKTITFNINSKLKSINDFILGRVNYSAPKNTYYESSNYYDVLGGFTLYNGGYNDHENVKLTYEYDSDITTVKSPNLLVSAAKVFAEAGQTITPEIVLVKSDGKQYGPYSNTSLKCSSSYDGVYVNASVIAANNGLSGEYYLKKITYTLPKIKGTNNNGGTNNYLYHSQGAGSQNSGGIMTGRIINNAHSKFTLELSDGSKNSVTNNTYVTTTPSFSGAIYKINTSSNNITAGEDFELKINLFSVGYPYTNSQAFKNPEVYLILPEGINIEDAIINSKENATTSEATPKITKVQSKIINEVINNIYKISFNSNVWFGYVGLSKTGVTSGSSTSKWVRVKLNTEESMDYTSINLRDNIYFKDANGHISLSGSYAKFFVRDVYDVDNDGSTSDGFGTIQETNKTIIIEEVAEE